jgi:hypothetical protein
MTRGFAMFVVSTLLAALLALAVLGSVNSRVIE